jgi:hypothetical protein
MKSVTEASQLAEDALALWEAGDLSGAESKYSQAIATAPAGHWAIPLVRAQWAGVLSQLDRDDEAREQWSRTLAEELSAAGGEQGSGVRSTRYFFAKHLLKMGLAQAALDMTAPLHGPKCEWLVKDLEAEALVKVGRRAEARAALQDALRLARSDSQREALTARLTELQDGLVSGDAG